MPLFKVSAGSDVPVSAVVKSNARTMESAISEVRGLQARARVNWTRAGKPIGAIQAPYEVWAVQEKDGSWTVSLTAIIQIVAQQTVIAEDQEAVQEAVQERQASGLIRWTYQGIPIGEYKEEIPTYWANRQADVTTNTTLTASSVLLFPGQSLTVFSDVSGPETPAGRVEFIDTTPGGLGVLASTVLDPDPVTHGLSHAQVGMLLPEGSYSMAASFVGSDGFAPSMSPTLAVVVNKVATTVTITPPEPPVFAGQSVSLNVEVGQANPLAPKPTGTITLFQGTDILALGYLDPSGESSTGSFGLGALSPGTYSFTVQYDGDDTHAPSTAVVSGITVQQATTTTVMTVLEAGFDSTLYNSVYSQLARLRATVSSVVPGTYPTGNVTFKDGSTPIATVALSPDFSTSGNSVAQITLDSLTVGEHPLSTEYAGNVNFAPSSSDTFTHFVSKANTFVNAFSTNSPTKFGQAAVFNGSIGVVSPATKTPFDVHGTSVTISFQDFGFTDVNLDSSGQATHSRSDFPVGGVQGAAVYSGHPEFEWSQTFYFHQVEKSDSITEIVVIAPDPVPFAVPATIITSVSAVAPGAGFPTGTVHFTVFDPNYYGNLFLGSANVESGFATLLVTFFAAITDSYTITAQYLGDGNFNSSSGQKTATFFGFFF